MSPTAGTIEDMDSPSMDVFGKALLAYQEGDAAAEVVIRREDGRAAALPVSHFFREPGDFSGIDTAAVGLARGRVLDVGAGAGPHSLALAERGLAVTSIDVSAGAAEVMRRRGLTDVYRADIFDYSGGPFDTVLLLGHGIGAVQTIAGLDRFLERAGELVVDGGRVVLDSLDVQKTDDPGHLAYQEKVREAGRYVGEIRMSFEFGGASSPICRWLHVDARTLAAHASAAGWRCEVIHAEPTGDYLARLVR